MSKEGSVEVLLADGTVVWIDRDSVVDFRVLASQDAGEGRTDALDLQRGRLRIETSGSERRRVAIHVDTAAGTILLRSAGSFRVEAQVDVTHLASFGGVAEFSGDEGSVLVRSGQASSVPIHGAPTAPRLFNTAHRDAFDRYHDARTAAYADPGEPGSANAVVPTGLPDELSTDLPELSFYGTWHTLPRYGVVWRPHSASGWSPFESGYWERYPAGWVWVSQEPWGWAPYRYGRWDHEAALGWFWIPGRVWSGGWVAFAVGATQIGWCPLNYWNQPAFHEPWNDGPGHVTGNRLDLRGWHFASIDRFGGPEAAPITGRRTTPTAGTTFVITRILPSFESVGALRRSESFAGLQELARRNRVPIPAPCAGAARVPFRMDEAPARQGPGPGVPNESMTAFIPGCPPVAPIGNAAPSAPTGAGRRPSGKPPQPPPDSGAGASDGSAPDR